MMEKVLTKVATFLVWALAIALMLLVLAAIGGGIAYFARFLFGW